MLFDLLLPLWPVTRANESCFYINNPGSAWQYSAVAPFSPLFLVLSEIAANCFISLHE